MRAFTSVTERRISEVLIVGIGLLVPRPPPATRPPDWRAGGAKARRSGGRTREWTEGRGGQYPDLERVATIVRLLYLDLIPSRI